MSLDPRDEMAAVVAATLAGRSDQRAASLARRAYDIADALLLERARRDAGAQDGDPGDMPSLVDPRLDAAPHDPRWEVEPRWSDRDLARLAERRVDGGLAGPGLASARPAPEDDEQTGT